MKKKIKIFNIIFLFMIFIFLVHNICYASDLTDLQDGMEDVSTVKSGTNKGIGKIINIGIGALQFFGSGIALITITMLGIKYVLASAQEKADLKKQAIPLVIGSILLFAGVNIAKIIADIGSGIS